MPKPKDPNEERERHEREQRELERSAHHEPEHEPERPSEGHEKYEDKDRPRRRRMGREHAVHQQIIERRLGGGAPATPEAYSKALDEWHQLPGSVMRPPTDENPSPEPQKQTPIEGDKENHS